MESVCVNYKMFGLRTVILGPKQLKACLATVSQNKQQINKVTNHPVDPSFWATTVQLLYSLAS